MSLGPGLSEGSGEQRGVHGRGEPGRLLGQQSGSQSEGTVKTAGGQGCESRRSEGQKHGVPWTRRLPSECGNGVELRPCPGCHGPRGQWGSAWWGLRVVALARRWREGRTRGAGAVTAGGSASRPRARCSAPRSPSACSAGNPWRRLRKPLHGPCWSVTRRGNRHRVGGFPSRPRSTHVGRGGAGRGCAPHARAAPPPPASRLASSSGQLLCSRTCSGERTALAKPGSVFLN